MIETIEEHSTQVGFNIARIQSLQPDFAKALDLSGRDWSRYARTKLSRSGPMRGT